MFDSKKRNPAIIAVVGLVLVATTVAVAFALKGDTKPGAHFALALLPVLLAEAWIGCSLASVAASDAADAMPRAAARPVVPACYFVFTLLAAAIGTGMSSLSGFAALQAVGLAVAIAVASGVFVASGASAASERESKAETAPRGNWKFSLERAALEARTAFEGDASAVGAIFTAVDKARFAASSLPGRPDLDEPAARAAAAVLSAVRAGAAAAAARAAATFVDEIEFREKALKAAR